MNKEELRALVAELLKEEPVEPMVKGSDYKPRDPGPQPESNGYHDGDFVEDVSRLDLRKLYLVENAHLFKAEDFDHDFIPFSDFYLFSPEGKWTYIHTHESYCGPYFYKLK